VPVIFMAPPARRPFAAVIFDLDGTLVDSIGDIADGANKALAELGHPPRPVSDYHKLYVRVAEVLPSFR